jgi:hypothetical protein
MYIHVISRDLMVTCPVWQNEDEEKKGSSATKASKGQRENNKRKTINVRIKLANNKNHITYDIIAISC